MTDSDKAEYPTPDDRALLVLDLDETLIHCAAQSLDEPPHFKAASYVGYRRPYLDEFFERLADHYRFAIWSSAGDKYVAEVVAAAMPAVAFEFVWGNTHGTLRRDFTLDEHYYAKDLHKLKKRERLERVLIVDDDPRKVAKAYGNAIYIREFEGDPTDTELRHLANYLASIATHSNFRQLEKRGWRAQAIRSVNKR